MSDIPDCQCQAEGCNKPGKMFEVPDEYWHEDESDYPVDFERFCEKHAFEAGYCWICGQFWGGVESFDFGKSGLCENCAFTVQQDMEGDLESYHTTP